MPRRRACGRRGQARTLRRVLARAARGACAVTARVQAFRKPSPVPVAPAETLALVGESGCGKSTTGRLVLRLLEPSAGAVYFDDKNIFDLSGEAMRGLRRALQIVFQDPYASLNPR